MRRDFLIFLDSLRLTNRGLLNQKPLYDTALFKCMRYIFFVESRAERDSQQKIWFYLSAKRCKEVVAVLAHCP